jgi:hypothetical protein
VCYSAIRVSQTATGNAAYSIPAYSPPARQQRGLGPARVLDVLSDLLGEDVCVAGVARDLTDHAQVYDASSLRQRLLSGPLVGLLTSRRLLHGTDNLGGACARDLEPVAPL